MPSHQQSLTSPWPIFQSTSYSLSSPSYQQPSPYWISGPPTYQPASPYSIPLLPSNNKPSSLPLKPFTFPSYQPGPPSPPISDRIPSSSGYLSGPSPPFFTISNLLRSPPTPLTPLTSSPPLTPPILPGYVWPMSGETYYQGLGVYKPLILLDLCLCMYTYTFCLPPAAPSYWYLHATVLSTGHAGCKKAGLAAMKRS